MFGFFPQFNLPLFIAVQMTTDVTLRGQVLRSLVFEYTSVPKDQFWGSVVEHVTRQKQDWFSVHNNKIYMNYFLYFYFSEHVFDVLGSFLWGLSRCIGLPSGYMNRQHTQGFLSVLSITQFWIVLIRKVYLSYGWMWLIWMKWIFIFLS